MTAFRRELANYHDSGHQLGNPQPQDQTPGPTETNGDTQTIDDGACCLLRILGARKFESGAEPSWRALVFIHRTEDAFWASQS